MFADRIKTCMHRLKVFSLYSLFLILFSCFLIPYSVKAEVPISKPDLSQPTGIAPAFFGPNALPIIDMSDGLTDNHLRLELAADGYIGFQNNNTVDIFARVRVPLFTRWANLSVWMPVYGWYKQYDGTALSTTEYTVTGIPEGFTHSATVTGFRTAAGTEDSIISVYHIYDRNGDNVATNFSNVSTVKGTLTVTPRALTITSGSATKAYDGTALTNSEYTVDGLAGSDGINVTVTGSLTAVGSAENSFTYTLEADPANYTITTNPGTLTVTGNTTAITLTAASADKTYDGTPLTAAGVTVSGLPSGFTCSASASGSQTDAGTSANTVSSYTILDGSFNNVTAYFSNIRTVDGELTVSRASATVTTGSAVMPYDGSELTNATATITGLVNGETATVTATGKITNIGKVKNTYSITWGTAKPANYNLTENLGELEVYDPDPDTSEPPSTDEP